MLLLIENNNIILNEIKYIEVLCKLNINLFYALEPTLFKTAHQTLVLHLIILLWCFRIVASDYLSFNYCQLVFESMNFEVNVNSYSIYNKFSHISLFVIHWF